MDSPAFGRADLTNCERELIHLAGSVQPHGALLVLREPDLTVLQASANTGAVLGQPVGQLLEKALASVDAGLARVVVQLAERDLLEPVPLQHHGRRGEQDLVLEGHLHRVAGVGLVLELEDIRAAGDLDAALELSHETLMACLGQGVQRFTAAATLGMLADAAVQVVRDLTGYDRVMVYRFDPDGHGKIIAEARDPRLDPLLGHHYPATDIPQRARELYLRNRVRILVNVDYEPQALVPDLLPTTGAPLDMSMCTLRSMSPLHLQYLRNMGVTGTLVASLVREGRLWGLIAAHHYSPRQIRYSVRAAVDLLAEVVSTRLAAIENYTYAQVSLMVRRLEQRLVEATSTEGDWRHALFRNPRTLLQPVEATGAALFHGGEVLTCGEVPSTPELRALAQWVDGQSFDGPLACSSVAKAEPTLASLTPTACGVLAVKLSTSRPDYLMWFRKEQLQTLTWAGNPIKAYEGNDPLQLSPRRSFEAWSEIVRGTALPWSSSEQALARAVGMALVDIILQVNAVRLLIAQHQLTQIRETVGSSREPVVIADEQGRLLFSNAAFEQLVGVAGGGVVGTPVADLFVHRETMASLLDTLSMQPWRGELALRCGGDPGELPVEVRAEAVPGRHGLLLGFIFTMVDLRESKRAAAARQHLEDALRSAAVGSPATEGARGADQVISAILTNASLAAMDIAEATDGPPVAPLLEELEASTQRAAMLYGLIRNFTR